MNKKVILFIIFLMFLFIPIIFFKTNSDNNYVRIYNSNNKRILTTTKKENINFVSNYIGNKIGDSELKDVKSKKNIKLIYTYILKQRNHTFKLAVFSGNIGKIYNVPMKNQLIINIKNNKYKYLKNIKNFN